MCNFIEVMEKLKSSSNSSVASEEFSSFNNYMHIGSKMDDTLASIIMEANKYSKSLVLVCGNSGDGKSHLIARLKEQGIIDESFSIYIDATSADRKGMKANDKLKEKLNPLSDANINDGKSYKLIVAINLGILNDFLKNYSNEFTHIRDYVESQELFDTVPSWRYEVLKTQEHVFENLFIGHIDFTSFHRYEIKAGGLNLDFINQLFGKIIDDNPRNEMLNAFNASCECCSKRQNCPVYWNYKKIKNDKAYRDYITEVLAASIIKHNISPTVRDINNFFYEIIIGNTFDEKKVNSSNTQRLMHFINNLSLNLLFENQDGLLAYIAKEDIFNDNERKYDKDLITLNLKPSFDKWLKDEASNFAAEFNQMYNTLLYCQENHAKEFKENESRIKRDIFKYFIRLNASTRTYSDSKFKAYLEYLYSFNVGNEAKCKDLINLIKDSVYVWNGRLGETSGDIVKNGVIYGRGTDRYFLYKNIEVTFKTNDKISKLPDGEYPNFATTMRFGFALKDKQNEVIKLDVDYELYSLLTEIGRGYVPTDNDRKTNVNFDSFVRTLLAKSESDMYVYSRYEDGKTYKIAKDEFGGYEFENEG